MLVDGTWTKDWDPIQAKDKDGRFVRQVSSFRHWIKDDGTSEYPVEAGRYHLYTALICPWACRTLAARALLGLQYAITVSIVEPALTDQGWRFGDSEGATGKDDLLGADYMHEIYTHADPHYTGRATVPVLWDKKTNTIVNNESEDILKILNGPFATLGHGQLNLRPDGLVDEIDDLNAKMYDLLNNGVYKAGFASTQQAYAEATLGVFSMLDELEERLSDGRDYLFGSELTESDIRLFVTLIRFDAAYHGIFKTNIRTLRSYTYLHAYTSHFYALPGIAETVNLNHIKKGYYSIKALNPNGIVPLGPFEDFTSTSK